MDTAQVAANSYCLRHYAVGYTGGTPHRLSLRGSDLWIVPVVLTSPGYGIVGEVGVVAIDGRSYGLRAAEQQLDQGMLFDLIRRQRFPIVFLYRRPIDRVDAAHAIIPVSLSRQHVSFLDPLLGQRRVTIRKFDSKTEEKP